MTTRPLLPVLALALVVVPLRSQGWVAARTAWGVPDLQGNWTSVDMLSVPVQRPQALGEKSRLTDEEFANLANSNTQRVATANDDAFTHSDSTAHWYENGRPQRQTSLIVDPPNGQFPSLTAAGVRTLAARPSETSGPMRGPEDATMLARCISRGPLGSMMPLGSNNGNQIIQAPGVVVIRNELIHETRLVPTDGRPHVGPGVRTYMGDARGRWDGDTLVVETTNLNGKDTLWMLSEHARLVERFTRVDDKTLQYQVTVDDPRTRLGRFTVAFPLRRDAGYVVFEYACHEGNYLTMTSMLAAARLEDK